MRPTSKELPLQLSPSSIPYSSVLQVPQSLVRHHD